MEAQGPARSELDQPADVVAVAGLLFQLGEDEQLRAAFFPFAIGIVLGIHMCDPNI
jgi:hypothetical protein